MLSDLAAGSVRRNVLPSMVVKKGNRPINPSVFRGGFSPVGSLPRGPGQCCLQAACRPAAHAVPGDIRPSGSRWAGGREAGRPARTRLRTQAEPLPLAAWGGLVGVAGAFHSLWLLGPGRMLAQRWPSGCFLALRMPVRFSAKVPCLWPGSLAAHPGPGARGGWAGPCGLCSLGKGKALGSAAARGGTAQWPAGQGESRWLPGWHLPTVPCEQQPHSLPPQPASPSLVHLGGHRGGPPPGPLLPPLWLPVCLPACLRACPTGALLQPRLMRHKGKGMLKRTVLPAGLTGAGRRRGGTAGRDLLGAVQGTRAPTREQKRRLQSVCCIDSVQAPARDF